MGSEGVASFKLAYSSVLEWLVRYCYPVSVSQCSEEELAKIEAVRLRWYSTISEVHGETVKFLAELYGQIDARKNLPNNDLRFTEAITCTNSVADAGPRCAFSDYSCQWPGPTSRKRGHTQTCPH